MEYIMTESKTPLTTEKVSEATPKVSSDKEATKTNEVKKTTKTSGSSDTTSKDTISKDTISKDTSSNKMSKLALLALLIAIAAPASHYYWQQIHHQEFTQILKNDIDQKNNATLGRFNEQQQQALSQQAQTLTRQFQQMLISENKTNQNKVATLKETIAHLEQTIKQRQPSDWLLHEAEYLIRIAARTLWLEQDTRAAIGLLKDANARLTDLNDPTFLPVRETIHQDINALEQMPQLDTDEVILTLMAMNKQVTQLPLALENLGNKDGKAAIELSQDINDWQTNLAKSWQKFLNDFIRVRQTTGTVDALISPEQQENLIQNLGLKIQLALWAATERKGDVYQKALTDIAHWQGEFFDMNNNINQHVAAELAELQTKQISYNYPNELSSLTAIRAILREQQSLPILTTPEKTPEKAPEQTPEQLNLAEIEDTL